MTKLVNRSKKDLLTEILKDPDRKPLLRMIFEVSYLSLIHREFPIHYFSRYLYKKQITNINDFLPNKFSGKISGCFNDAKLKSVLDNKLYFDFFYRQFDISLPKILMYNHGKMFVTGHKSSEVNTIHDFMHLLEEIFDRNPSYDSMMIKKTCSSSSGDKIYKLFLYQLRRQPEMISEIFSEVIISEFLFQETVKQHPDLNRLNSSCLNTMRLDTFINKDGKIDIISGYIRMSISNSCIDNISSGGGQVGIFLDTGRLKKYAYAPINTIGEKVMTKHPVSNMIFENFCIHFSPRQRN